MRNQITNKDTGNSATDNSAKQTTQQHNKPTLKNTYRKKEIIAKGKI